MQNCNNYAHTLLIGVAQIFFIGRICEAHSCVCQGQQTSNLRKTGEERGGNGAGERNLVETNLRIFSIAYPSFE